MWKDGREQTIGRSDIGFATKQHRSGSFVCLFVLFLFSRGRDTGQTRPLCWCNH